MSARVNLSSRVRLPSESGSVHDVISRSENETHRVSDPKTSNKVQDYNDLPPN